jgi:AcrR family transcriptional regulator
MPLITERDFESISVNDICDRAMVHRTTFYNHYKDKYNLLNSGMLEMYEELRAGSAPPEQVIQNYDPEHPPIYFVNLLEHVLDKKKLLHGHAEGERSQHVS